MKRLLLACLLMGWAMGGLASKASARELPQQIRRMAERAFLEGRLDDLDSILAAAREPLDRFPILLRDLDWRRASPTGNTTGQPDTAERAFFEAVLSWMRNPKGPHPASRGGGDPYPILTALVQDRLRRETRGAEGLPNDSALVALSLGLDPKKDENEVFFLATRTRELMGAVYHGYDEDELQRQIDAEAEALGSRNGWWALVCVLAFLLLSAGFLRVVVRA